ncbi:methyl-accepting chemotaxis protein [Acetonema longum]|uniref:Methyl-accepting chemotaxis sensory transducer n=1 Tax=Acetonema longum DSM 6540 TaxID=1009370 RepID=F7NG49_9FIRM|nr:HAMP domain-containing methyl-accepting chemotaxis protein [Acetonema longum]EGO64967.1 methyl-accepting chemotaxis sensory transducer [Acetonema longum DSM 6540]
MRLKIRLSIGAQILACSIAVAVAFTAVNAFAYYKVIQIERSYEQLLSYSISLIKDVKGVNIELWNQSTQVRSYVMSADKRNLQQYWDSQQRMQALLATLGTRMQSPEAEREFSVWQLAIRDYVRILDNGISVRDKIGQEDTVKYFATIAERAEGIDAITRMFLAFIDNEVAVKKEENHASVIIVENTVMGLNALIFLLVVGFSFWISRRIARSLAGVVIVADRIADGDLTYRSLNYKGDDEIGDLVKSFQTMTEHLRNLMSQVRRSVEQVASSSQQLTAIAEQSAQAASQVAGNVAQVAGGAANQVSAAERSVAIVGDMYKAIHHIAATAGKVSIYSDDAAKAAVAGSETVSQATGQIRTITETVNKSAQAVQKLGASSQQIGEIVDVITGIAGQTNLLALNAAIEAARAGEAGRGFAVVADEVRTLAEQSQEAAQKIADIVRSIQTETGVAVRVMNEGAAEVEQGTKSITATGDTFNHIVILVQGLNRQIQEISAAAQQLSASSDEVVKSVNGVKSIATDTAGNTQTISAAAEEQSASMEEISSSSQALSLMAADLQTAIGKFKL